jgi:hypothetical protein
MGLLSAAESRTLDSALRGAILSRPVDYRHFTQQV